MTLSVRVSNHSLVTALAAAMPCPPTDSLYNKILFRVDLDALTTATTPMGATILYSNTGVLTTASSIFDLVVQLASGQQTAELEIEGCGDGAGIRDPYITLTIHGHGPC